ncbi:class I SAM-dependent methyltransferase [Pseudonocardia thermophila]|uniref:class I SAM-dependent methyltransferase n=1 Tax=Pseudonocardia thermophila TaxID=1848 RepID=UPI00389AF61B
MVDARDPPYADASPAGVVCWCSLMYLPPAEQRAVFAELARVVGPGGYLVSGFKAGDDRRRRGGRGTAWASRSTCGGTPRWAWPPG